MAEFYESVCRYTTNYKAISNWLMGPVRSLLNEKTLRERQFPVDAERIGAMINLIDNGTISQTAAQKVFSLMAEGATEMPDQLAGQHNLIQNRNTDALGTLVEEVLAAWPDKVAQYKKGKKNLLGMFMGEVMKKSQGSADPKLVNALLMEKLNQ